MNQLDALVTVLEFLGEQPSADSREMRRAIKVLTKRAEVLRIRYERRNASAPEDLADEPITFTDPDIIDYFRCGPCACGRSKPCDFWFCEKCFNKLDPQLRKALQGMRHLQFRNAFCRAVRLNREANNIIIPQPNVRSPHSA
jgi:hypothetical protein